MRAWRAPEGSGLAALRMAPEEAVEDVLTGPISRPLVDAGPANVGGYTPKLDVVTPLVWAPVAVPVLAASATAAITAGSDSNDTRTAHLRLMLLRMLLPPSGGSPHASQEPLCQKSLRANIFLPKRRCQLPTGGHVQPHVVKDNPVAAAGDHAVDELVAQLLREAVEHADQAHRLDERALWQHPLGHEPGPDVGVARASKPLRSLLGGREPSGVADRAFEVGRERRLGGDFVRARKERRDVPVSPTLRHEPSAGPGRARQRREQRVV